MELPFRPRGDDQQSDNDENGNSSQADASTVSTVEDAHSLPIDTPNDTNGEEAPSPRHVQTTRRGPREAASQPSWWRYQEMVRAAELMELHQSLFGDNPSRPTFVGCKARGNGNLTNGISIEGVADPETLTTIAESGGSAYYLGCTAQNGGHVVNGVKAYRSQSHEQDLPESLPVRGYYVDCGISESDEGMKDSVSTVVNGICYIHMPSQ